MNRKLAAQFSLDYCCTVEDVLDGNHHFTRYQPLPGRRRYKGDEACALKIAAIGGKLLFTGRDDLLPLLEEKYRNADAAWFMEVGKMSALDAFLREHGLYIDQAHPFYISEEASPVCCRDFTVLHYNSQEILQFRGDERWNEAYAYHPFAPDMIGYGAVIDGQLVGMAGASADSPELWQIGINVLTGHEGQGIGTALVSLLKNEILSLGHLPYYGTAMSHMASQRVALKSGFLPTWCELTTKALER